MTTRELRVKLNNEWPMINHEFHAEAAFKKLLAENDNINIFLPAKLNYCEDYDFQFYLSFNLDALEMIPNRPDLAFDNIWKILDAEFFKVKEAITSQESRFDLFVNKLLDNRDDEASFIPFLNIIPMQTCEYAMKRIIEASKATDKDTISFFKRARNVLQPKLTDALLEKYNLDSSGKLSDSNQRKAGALLQLLFRGNTIKLELAKQNENDEPIVEDFSLNDKDKLKLLLKIIFANYRNERFHGSVFPPFRSSTAKLKTYVHAYYLFNLAYCMLLEVFLYKDYNVIDHKTVNNVVKRNLESFIYLFKNQLKK